MNFFLQEAENQYSHLDPASPAAAAQDTEAATQQGEAANLEDEELLRALQQTEEIGELEATDLMQFAYQIASGMVRMSLSDYPRSGNFCDKKLSHDKSSHKKFL